MEKKEFDQKNLASHSSGKKSGWKEKAKARQGLRSQYWHKCAIYVSLQIQEALELQNITQKELASRMGCKAQYVSRIISAQENMTIETLGKISEALSIDIDISKRAIDRMCIPTIVVIPVNMSDSAHYVVYDISKKTFNQQIGELKIMVEQKFLNPYMDLELVDAYLSHDNSQMS